MLELIKRGLITWNEQKNQRLKLQQAYVALAIISLTIGGGLILISNSAAHLAASIAGIVGVVFLVTLSCSPPPDMLLSNHETISICQNTQSTL